MNKIALTFTIVPLLLMGCAHDHGVLGKGWNPTKPIVEIKGGVISPDQLLLVFPPKVSGSITWTLADPKFEFAEKGIEIEGVLTDNVIRGEQVRSVVLNPKQVEIVECTRSTDGLQFKCNNKHTGPGVYKYTIRIKARSSSDKSPPDLDPVVVNM